MKAKILNVAPYFVEEGQNDSFHWRFIDKLQDATSLLLKSVDFSSLCGIICQWGPYKNGKKPLYGSRYISSSNIIYSTDIPLEK